MQALYLPSIPPNQYQFKCNSVFESVYFNNPIRQANVFVDTSAIESIRNEQIVNAIQLICPNVFQNQNHDTNKASIFTNDVKIEALGGGLSNYLFTVKSQRDPDICVLVRIHVGEEDDRFVDRNVENKIMAWLSQQKLSPCYYGRFQNGRIEQFYQDHQTLVCHELKSPKFAPQIAHQMAQLHLLRAPLHICKTELDQDAQIWSRIDGWFHLIFQSLSHHDHSNNAKVKALQVESYMYNEWKWLLSVLQSSSTPSPSSSSSTSSLQALIFSRQTVFTHMDLQSLNILYPKSESNPGINLIDFEYAGHNPRAADIANTFCEHCDCNHLCPDYPNEYPSKEQQTIFLSNYLQFIKNNSHSKDHQYHIPSHEDSENWNTFVEEFRNDVNRYSLLSHLGWSVWSVAQALNSPIDFDYIQYATIRMKGYHWAKENFF